MLLQTGRCAWICSGHDPRAELTWYGCTYSSRGVRTHALQRVPGVSGGLVWCGVWNTTRDTRDTRRTSAHQPLPRDRNDLC